MPPVGRDLLSALGILLYSGVGVASACSWTTTSSTTASWRTTRSHGQHYGILLIEFGVGVTVAAVMILIFYCFAGRSRVRADEEAGIEREGNL